MGPDATLGQRWQSAEVAQSPILRTFGNLHGVVRGRRYVHNPRIENGLIVLGRSAARLLDQATGDSVAQTRLKLAAQGVSPGQFDAALDVLSRNRLIALPGLRDHSLSTPARPKRSRPRRFDLWVHVTNACNLRCPYCYIHKSEDHLQPEAAARILTTIERTAQTGRVDVIHARYAGGEPMLRLAAMQRFHAEAKRRCAQHGVRFTAAILTNGTAITDAGLSWLQSEQVSVSVSIDGTAQTQDRMRPTVTGAASWPLLQRGLARYFEAGIRPYALVTVGPENIDNMPELTAFLLDHKTPFRYSLVRDMQWGKQAFTTSGVLDGEPLRHVNSIFGRCYAQIEADMSRRVDQGDLPDPSFRATHRFCDLSPWRPIRKACGAGETFVALGHDGTVSPCQAALHESAAPASGDDLFALAQAYQPFGEFKRQAANDGCSRCRHAPSCAGGCPLLLHRRDGHIDGRSPYCEVFRFVLPRIVAIAALELLGHASKAAKTTELRDE